MNKKSFILKDDYKLLRVMLYDAKFQNNLYSPGPYWLNKTKVATNHIQKLGLSDFRGSSSLIGLSFTDTVYLDIRKGFEYRLKLKLFKFILEKVFPFNKAFNMQVKLTNDYAGHMFRFKREYLKNNQRVIKLLSKYKVPYSLLGGCLDYIEINGKRISSLYLDLLEQLDQIAEKVDYKNAKSVFEIGGGFGVNIHLLLENFQNIRKIIYVDIPPNLYTGTQYLKAFFGEAIKDYNQTRHLKEIVFKNNEELEIFPIAPWQIEKISAEVSVFYNSNSFVEMPMHVVKNYASYIKKLPNYDKTSIVLTTYDRFNLSDTLDPDILKMLFNPRQFNHYYLPSLLDKTRNNMYYISVGKNYHSSKANRS